MTNDAHAARLSRSWASIGARRIASRGMFALFSGRRFNTGPKGSLT